MLVMVPSGALWQVARRVTWEKTQAKRGTVKTREDYLRYEAAARTLAEAAETPDERKYFLGRADLHRARAENPGAPLPMDPYVPDTVNDKRFPPRPFVLGDVHAPGPPWVSQD